MESESGIFKSSNFLVISLLMSESED